MIREGCDAFRLLLSVSGQGKSERDRERERKRHRICIDRYMKSIDIYYRLIDLK